MNSDELREIIISPPSAINTKIWAVYRKIANSVPKQKLVDFKRTHPRMTDIELSAEFYFDKIFQTDAYYNALRQRYDYIVNNLSKTKLLSIYKFLNIPVSKDAYVEELRNDFEKAWDKMTIHHLTQDDFDFFSDDIELTIMSELEKRFSKIH